LLSLLEVILLMHSDPPEANLLLHTLVGVSLRATTKKS
jgi:hypothetical protein